MDTAEEEAEPSGHRDRAIDNGKDRDDEAGGNKGLKKFLPSGQKIIVNIDQPVARGPGAVPRTPTDNRADIRGDFRGGNRADNRPDNRSDNRPDNRGGNRADNVDAQVERRRPALKHESEPRNLRAPKGLPAETAPKPAPPFTKETPQPVKSSPQPTKSYPQPIKSFPEPIKSSPQPMKSSPEPIKSSPQPRKPIPETVKATPVPVKSTPEPVKQEAPKKATSSVKPATIADLTPVRKLVPKSCVIETLSIGDVVLLSVDNKASECRAGTGFVCLSLHQSVEADYQAVCEDYGAACELDNAPYTVTPGESFSYLNPEDGAWYRARCVGPSLAALLDSSKVVALTAADKCKRLPAKYELVPEFCCLLQADGVKIGDGLKCTLLAETSGGFTVSVENAETGASLGKGEVARWLPEVEYPKKPAATEIPSVQRPGVTNNSTVFLVDATSFNEVFVRPADTASQISFDAVLQDVVLYGQGADPLKEPPQQGQVVVAKFTDGFHYRALIRRTNVRQNKYQLEYIEFGNIHVCTLEDLYPCPPNLDLPNSPVVTSKVILQTKAEYSLTPPAIQYIDKLKHSSPELTLKLANGAATGPSGSTVILAVAKTNKSINRKLEEMCTPEWKKIEERGGDVIETERIMFSDLQYLDLPSGECELTILDASDVPVGIVSGYLKGHPHANYVLNTLTEKMGQYCNSDIGREPYLPKEEELCIAQCPPFPQWFRAVLMQQISGPGGATLRVLYIDYGNVEVIPVTLVRKMLPEFVKDLPALVNTIEIIDYPKDPTKQMQLKAIEHLKLDDEGRGVLRVTKCIRTGVGEYRIEAPELIAAMMTP